MKKPILLLVIFALFLTACGAEQEKQVPETLSSYNRETDDQPYWSGLKNAVATKYGYYFMISHKLYLYNDKAKKITPLCGRADCPHKGTEDCNAIFTDFIEYIGYYDGYLYMVGMDNDELYLYQVTVDGSKRTKLCKLGLLDDDTNGISFMAATHRGYFYYSITTFEPVPTNRTAAAYRIPLTGHSHEKEGIYHIAGLGASIFGFWAYDNTVLFSSATLEKSSTSQPGYEFSEHEHCYYDTNQNKVITNVLKGSDEDTDTLYAADNTLYFCKGKKLYRMSLPDGTAEEINTDIFEGEPSVITYDFTDLYCLDYATGNIRVYDTKNFTKKQEIQSYKQTDTHWEILFGDDKYLFAVKDNSSCLQVYDKKQNGTWQSIDFSMWD